MTSSPRLLLLTPVFALFAVLVGCTASAGDDVEADEVVAPIPVGLTAQETTTDGGKTPYKLTYKFAPEALKY